MPIHHAQNIRKSTHKTLIKINNRDLHTENCSEENPYA